MNEDKPETSTQIAEGLLPAPLIDDDRAAWPEPNLRVNEPSAIEIFFAWEKLQ